VGGVTSLQRAIAIAALVFGGVGGTDEISNKVETLIERVGGI
jgi:hypothetical protein